MLIFLIGDRITFEGSNGEWGGRKSVIGRRGRDLCHGGEGGRTKGRHGPLL